MMFTQLTQFIVQKYRKNHPHFGMDEQLGMKWRSVGESLRATSFLRPSVPSSFAAISFAPLLTFFLCLGLWLCTSNVALADEITNAQTRVAQTDIIVSHTVGLRQIGCPIQDNIAATEGTPLSFYLTLRNNSNRTFTEHQMTRTIDWFPRLTTEVYTLSFSLAPGETFTFTNETLIDVFNIPASFNEEAADVDMLVDVVFLSSDGKSAVTQRSSAIVYVPSIRLENGISRAPGCSTQDELLVALRETVYPCITLHNESRLATLVTDVEDSLRGALLDAPITLGGLETITLPLSAGISVPTTLIDQRFVSTTTAQATSRSIAASDSVTLSLYVLDRETFLPYMDR